MADKQQPKKRMGPCKWTLCVSLLVCCVDGSASEDQTAKPGDDVTLQCLGTRGAEILGVKWIRPDLKKEEGYVFFFRENRPYENYQHPSFRGRVKLINPELKDGNFSVILKNVSIDDTGTYECLVGMNNHPDISVHNISLTVTDSHPGSTDGRTGEGGAEDGGAKEGGAKEGGAKEGGDEDGWNTDRNLGLAVGLPVAVVLGVVVVGFLIYRKQRRPTEQDSYQPAPQQADVNKDGTEMKSLRSLSS